MNSNTQRKKIASELEDENETFSFYPPVKVPPLNEKITNCVVQSQSKTNSLQQLLILEKSPCTKAPITASKKKIIIFIIFLLIICLISSGLLMGLLYWSLVNHFVQMRNSNISSVNLPNNTSLNSSNDTSMMSFNGSHSNVTENCELKTLKDIQDVLVYVSNRNMDYLGFLIVGKHPGYPLKRSLIKFENPPKICNNSYIAWAKMYIKYWYAHKASYLKPEDYPRRNITLQLYRVNKDWSEKEATSKYRLNSRPWNSSYLSLDGSDADANAQDSIHFDQGQRSGFIEFDVTDAVRSWRADNSTNHGFLFKVADETFEGRDTRFYSREAVPSNRPYILIYYSS